MSLSARWALGPKRAYLGKLVCCFVDLDSDVRVLEQSNSHTETAHCTANNGHIDRDLFAGRSHEGNEGGPLPERLQDTQLPSRCKAGAGQM